MAPIPAVLGGRLAASLLLAAGASGATASAQAGREDPSRFTLLGSAVLLPASLSLDDRATFTEFAEEGRVDSRAGFDAGWGGELGLRYLFRGGLGFEALVSLAGRDGSADYAARFPHPLYLDRFRTADGSADGLSYRELATHVNLAYGRGGGRVRWALFAGVTVFNRVEVDRVGAPRYEHSFPYDSVTVTGVPLLRERGDAVGWNAGGEIAVRLGGPVDVAALARYRSGTVELAAEPARELDLSGVAVGLGLRVRF